MARVTINLYNLWVEIEDDTKYPDAVSDLSHRCLDLYKEALKNVKENGIDLTQMAYEDFGIEEEEED
jgi:hypothetical protein